MHNAAKILMGSTQSSEKGGVGVYAVDPATFKAGLAVRLKSDGLLSVLGSDGNRIGVSLGKSLSDHKKTSVLRDGLRVPMLATLKRASGIITITSYANLVSGTDDAITIGGVAFVAQVGAAVSGAATFQAATSNADTAQSLANQINDHAVANLLVRAISGPGATVTLYSIVEGIGGTGTGNDIAVSYTDNDTNVGLTLTGLSGGKLSGGSDTISDINYMTKGSKAYINYHTGKLDRALGVWSVVSDATYVAGPLTGVDEDAADVAVGLVDMPGGL